jgi:histidinol phosphatase-like enzyme (inositol monophosphatase family)
MPTPSPTALLATAHRLADAAGQTILPHFRRPIAVDNKAAKGFDPVTIADTAAEQAMRALIAKLHPDHGIIGEEFDDVSAAGTCHWILDPIDGTRAFITGYPLWGTLIGLVDGTTPILGMMDQPYTRERFWATPTGRTKSARLRGPDGKDRAISTRACPKLADAVLACTSPDMFKTPAERAGFEAVSRRVKLTRFGGDCYAYCMLAAGHVDLVIEANLKAVDIMPLVPIIEAAGGVVTTWDGGSAIRGGAVVAAGDAKLHAAAMKLLRG